MDFGFFTDETLFDHFCQNKTKMSTIEEPLMFLRHLKDNRLITDELYVSLILKFQTNNILVWKQKSLTVLHFCFSFLKQKLENTGDDNGVYCALDYIEKRGKKNVRKFWQCVAKEHILQRYSQLSEVTAALMNCEKSC